MNVASQTVAAMEGFIQKVNAHPLLGPDKIDFKVRNWKVIPGRGCFTVYTVGHQRAATVS